MQGEIRDLSQFHKEVINLNLSLVEEYKKSFQRDLLPADADVRLKNGLSIVEAESFYIDSEFLKSAFELWTSFLAESIGLKDEVKVLKKRFSNPSELLPLLRSFLKKDSNYFENLEREVGVEVDVLLFFAENITRPIVSGIVEMMNGNLNYDLWNRNLCPVCNSTPAFARIRKEDGKRFLYCSLCGKSWEFKRLKCVWCLNEDFKKLGFLLVDDKSPWRIDVCEVCKGYIKTRNERKEEKEFNELGLRCVMEMEFETRYLDDIAERNGYSNFLNKKYKGVEK